MVDRAARNRYVIQNRIQAKIPQHLGKVTKIQIPEIIEDHECHQCAQRENTPDTATIHMLTNDLPIRYNGERQDEDHWNPPELQMQTIIRPHDNKQYELNIEIRYES